MFKKFVFVFVALSMLLSGCSLPMLAAPTSTPTLTATASATATLTATSTLTPTATLTATPTFTPTVTRTPRPTSTPRGFYENETLGLALTLPNGWIEGLKDDTSVMFINTSEELMLFVFTAPGVQPITPAEMHGEIFGKLKTTLVAEDTAKIGQQTVDRMVFTYTTEKGVTLKSFLMVTHSSSLTYVFLVTGNDAKMSGQTRQIDNLLTSVQFREQLYGIERNQALVMLGYDPDPEDLDPARTLGGAYGAVGLVFSGLVRLSPQLQVVPDLAESWQVSADQTVYTFTLRSDLTFANGTPLTAYSVKESWERAAAPETASETVLTYMGDILGLSARHNGEADEIAGVQVVDERTLRVTLDAPKIYFLAKLTYPTSFVVDVAEAEADPENWMFTANASGPYTLNEIVEEEALIFQRNEGYYEPAKLPFIIQRVPTGPSLSYYEANAVDFAYIGSKDAQAIQAADHPLHEQLLSSSSLCTNYIAFNNTLPPFDDVNVRKAFALSVDRAALNETFFDGLSTLANAVLPPAMPGYPADQPTLTYDPQAARAALAESAYAGKPLPTIIFEEAGYADDEDPFTAALINNWEQVLGVQITVRYVDPQKFVDALRANEGQIVSSGWCADYPDPENFLDTLFHSASKFNSVSYANPQVDALLEQARSEPDPQKRLLLYREVERLLHEDFAVLPMFYSNRYALVKPSLKNFVLSPMSVPMLHLLEK